MSKLMGFVAAAALIVSVPAFAQSSTAPAPAAPAASTDSAAPSDNAGAPMKHHHHMHMRHERNSDHGSMTDNDADKLNACQVNATPTRSQEQCLREAENSRS